MPARGAPFTHWNPERAGPSATTRPSIEATQGTARGEASRPTAKTRAESLRAGSTRTTTTLARPSPSAAVQAVAGSRSVTSGPIDAPVPVSRRICAAGTGRDSSYGGRRPWKTTNPPSSVSSKEPPIARRRSRKPPARGIPREKRVESTQAGAGSRSTSSRKRSGSPGMRSFQAWLAIRSSPVSRVRRPANWRLA